MPARSTTVTPELRRSMIRDTALVRLTEVNALVIWAVVAVLIVLGLALAATPGTRDDAAPPLVAGLLFAVLYPPLVVGTTRKAMTAGLPIGSTVSVDVGDGSLRVESARGSSEVRYTAYRAVIERGSVVLLRVRGSRLVNPLPRELLDEDDLTRLRDGIAAAVSVP